MGENIFSGEGQVVIRIETLSPMFNHMETVAMTNTTKPNNSDKRKLRPRRPLCLTPGDLPDDSLVDKYVRRAVSGLGDSQTYTLIQQGRFPAPLKLGPRCSRWRMGDLRRWLADPLNFSSSPSVEGV